MPLDLGFLILLAIIAAGLGFSAAGVASRDSGAPARRLGAGRCRWGWEALALAVLGLAEVGVLTPWAIGGLLAVGLVVGGKEGDSSGRLAIWPRSFGRDALGLAFDVLLGLTLLGTLLTTLAPVTDGDALCYHLQVPKVFLAQRSAVFEPDLHETIYPLVTESLYAVGLGLRGPVACRLIQWLLGLAFAANVAAIARPILGDRARWAGTIALLVPAVSNGMGAPLNDVALAAFGNAAIHAWIRWRDRPSWRSATLAGVLIGPGHRREVSGAGAGGIARDRVPRGPMGRRLGSICLPSPPGRGAGGEGCRIVGGRPRKARLPIT